MAQFNMHPEWDWHYFETSHFRLFYTTDLSDWAHHIAPKMESIHEQVVVHIGYSCDEKIDVFLMDPMGSPNGMALPLKRHPLIILWVTAPGPESFWGGAEDWSELVFCHEDVHIVHLTLRSRNRWQRILNRFLPVGSMALKCPRYVSEGYAVILESRLTGNGRCQSTFRATLLRQLALEGKLPDYEELNGSEQWLGGSYPYMVGSAFLEWLQARTDNPDCLLHLWKRMTAKKNRSYEAAFKGLFRESPSDLYDRFRAELTARAISFEQQVNETESVHSTPWAEFKGFASPGALDSTGEQLALVHEESGKPAHLLVLSMTQEKEPDSTAAQEDPEDIPDLPPLPAPRKELYRFTERNGIHPGPPRWTHDGKTLLFHAPVFDHTGTRRFDIFRWTPKTNDIERITRIADLKYPDPLPDGIQAAVVYQHAGKSAPALLNLQTGKITYLSPPAITAIWGTPRVSPDGSRIAISGWGQNESWIEVFDVAKNTSQKILAPTGTLYAYPAWHPDGRSIFLTSDETGVFNVIRIDTEGSAVQTVTHAVGGTLAPLPVLP
ncbi:PD40 domain-containing protein, partial [bacterium]|nr:PD40 domain-containing protein [candidate division CSSED10-310 bacterium]